MISVQDCLIVSHVIGAEKTRRPSLPVARPGWHRGTGWEAARWKPGSLSESIQTLPIASDLSSSSTTPYIPRGWKSLRYMMEKTYPNISEQWMAGILKTQPHFRTFSQQWMAGILKTQKAYPYSGSAAQIFIWTTILENFRTRCIPDKFLDVSLHQGALQPKKLERKETSRFCY